MARQQGVEGRIMDILNLHKEQATAELDLKTISGLADVSFRDAMIRLVSKGDVVKWKTETFVNYFVATPFAAKAYYTEEITIDALYAVFGHGSRVLSVQRSIPFVMLPDEDFKVEKKNRYRELL